LPLAEFFCPELGRIDMMQVDNDDLVAGLADRRGGGATGGSGAENGDIGMDFGRLGGCSSLRHDWHGAPLGDVPTAVDATVAAGRRSLKTRAALAIGIDAGR